MLASEADFAAVVRCTVGLIGAESESVSADACRLLALLYQRKLTAFTMADLRGAFPEWTPYAYKAALQGLQDFGHIESPHGGRGRLRPYRLAARAADAASIPNGIRLRAADVAPVTSESTHGDLAIVGETSVANFAPRLTGT